MGYKIDERNKEMHIVSTLKWACRRNGNIYEKESSQTKKEKTNLCKNQPKVSTCRLASALNARATG